MPDKVALKIAAGGLGSAFILGIIFWAGAAYNRLSSIEFHMTSIDAKVSDFGALSERVNNMRSEIDQQHRINEELRQELRALEIK